MLHPAVLSGLALLVVNDHLLKATFPGVVTGKLSDVAGLAFFPVLLWSIVEVLLSTCKRPWGPSRRLLVGCVVVTGLVFSSTKTWPPAAEAYRLALAILKWPVLGELAPVSFVVDPTDLLALPALAVPLLVGARRCRRAT
jgi:hypothetical protein